MATNQTDFSAYTLNAQPSDWTSEGATGTTFEVVTDNDFHNIGGKALEMICNNITSGSESVRFLLSWDVPADTSPTVDDTRIRGAFRFFSVLRDTPETTGNSTYEPIVGLCIKCTSRRQCYWVAVTVDGDGNVIAKVGYYDGTFFGGLGVTVLDMVVEEGAWVNVEFEMVNLDMRAKFWLDGEPEPATWEIETQENASFLFSDGAPGVIATGWVHAQWREITVGDNGSAAPAHTLFPVAVPTAAAASNITATSAQANWTEN